MTIHFVSLDPETTIPILQAAKPDDMTLLEFEAAILGWWGRRWLRSTPQKQQKLKDSLSAAIAKGKTDAISQRG